MYVTYSTSCFHSDKVLGPYGLCNCVCVYVCMYICMNILHGRTNAQIDTLSWDFFLEELWKISNVPPEFWSGYCQSINPERHCHAICSFCWRASYLHDRRHVAFPVLNNLSSYLPDLVVPTSSFLFSQKILLCYLILSKVTPLYDRTSY